MRSRPVFTLSVGVLLAMGSVYLVRSQISPESELVAAQPPFVTANAVVAAGPLAFGERIEAEHLRETLWPTESLPEGAFKAVEDVLGGEGAEARIALRSINAGELLTTSNVSGFGGKATLASVLPEDKRAFTIRVNDVTGVAGFLLPGDRVDILLTRRDGDRGSAADVILQDIRVRGIDQIVDEGRDRPTVARTVTVEVAPEEAQKLALAMEVGTLNLALRNTLSVERPEVRTVRVRDLVDSEQAVRGPAVRVRRGGTLSVEDVRR